MRKTAYVLRFFKGSSLVKASIHPYWEPMMVEACELAARNCSIQSAIELEQLVLGWDLELGPMMWKDSGYILVLQGHEGKYLSRDDNDCTIISFRRPIVP